MQRVTIFQSTIFHLSYNSIFCNPKSIRFKVDKQKNVTPNFQEQSFEISDESMTAI